MRADGMTCRLRYSPFVTKGLCSTERIIAGDPHSELWILGGKLSPNPRVMEAPETGYPELALVQILLDLI